MATVQTKIGAGEQARASGVCALVSEHVGETE